MAIHAGVQQLMNMAALGQMPEGETIDKLMQAMAPEIRARSRAIEAHQRENGFMFASNVAQFYPRGRVVTILGDDGNVVEQFDIDPDSLVPAHTDADYSDGRVRGEVVSEPRPRMDRAKNFMRQFELNIKPGSLLRSADTAERLLYVTLRRQGDLPRRTMLKKLGIQNLGPEPKGSVIDQLDAEKLQDAKLMGQSQAVAMLSGGMLAGGGGAPDGGAGGAAHAAAQNAQPDVGAHREGRPPSGQQMPHQRNDGKLSES
jgi:hypothetical protein